MKSEITKPNILFVPSNSSHMMKNAPLLQYLYDNNYNVNILSIDNYTDQLHHTSAIVRQMGYHVDQIPNKYRSYSRYNIFMQYWNIINLICTITKYIKSNSIKSLILCSDVNIVNRILIKVAKRYRIPSMVIIDGLLPMKNPKYHNKCTYKSVLLNVYYRLIGLGPRGTGKASQYLVMNKSGVAEMIAMGVPRDHIVHTGSPEFDAYNILVNKRLIPKLQSSFLEHVKELSLGNPIVLFAHQELPLSIDKQKIFYDEFICASAASNAFLLVKLHPRAKQSTKWWNKWVAGKSSYQHKILFMKNECDSINILSICKICVSMFSTMVIEAFIQKIPVILIQYLNTRYYLDYDNKYKSVLVAITPTSLQECIGVLIKTQEMYSEMARRSENVLSGEFFGLDGKSCERIVGMIKNNNNN